MTVVPPLPLRRKVAVAVCLEGEVCLREECQNFHQKLHFQQLVLVQLLLVQVVVLLHLQDHPLEDLVDSIHLPEVSLPDQLQQLHHPQFLLHLLSEHLLQQQPLLP